MEALDYSTMKPGHFEEVVRWVSLTGVVDEVGGGQNAGRSALSVFGSLKNILIRI